MKRCNICGKLNEGEFCKDCFMKLWEDVQRIKEELGIYEDAPELF